MRTWPWPAQWPCRALPLRAVVLLSATALLSGCEREQRLLQTAPPFQTARAPGPQGYDGNAWAVGEGKRWFRWYNCNGCHASGGGDIGPALMDAEWRYGHQPAQIVASILQGRPNGMPAFSARMPQDQAWQLAAYIRSMSGQLQTDVAPSRSDSLSAGPPEQRRDKLTPRPGDVLPPPRPVQP